MIVMRMECGMVTAPGCATLVALIGLTQLENRRKNWQSNFVIELKKLRMPGFQDSQSH